MREVLTMKKNLIVYASRTGNTEKVAKEIVASGQTEAIAVTMGHRGAMLVSQDGALRLPAIASSGVAGGLED
jgi:sulfite reductase alpha subunit-like flavoprotein